MTSSEGLVSALLGLLMASCAAGGMGQSVTKEGRGSAAAPLSAPIAVGATIAPEIAIETQGSTSPALDLMSVRPQILEAKGHTLTGRAPGVSAVLIRGRSGHVIDLLHVWVAPATHLAVHRVTDEGADLGAVDADFDLMVGEMVGLAPRAYSGPQRLAGHGVAKWTVDPPERVRVLRDGVPERRRLLAQAPGAATLTIETLGQLAKVHFTVLGGPS